ncbi:MAG: hypothetical protein LBP55_06285 [Candidatus Adiutrix sp.]|nr:hypothetical protein [Candidatus Adiutrix sp.]
MSSRKIILISLAILILVAAPSSPALAKKYDFDLFTAENVPDKWSVSDEGGIVRLVSDDRKVAFLITTGLSTTAHKAAIDSELSKYSDVLADHPERKVTLTRIKGKRVVVTILGDNPDRVPVYYGLKENVRHSCGQNDFFNNGKK